MGQQVLLPMVVSPLIGFAAGWLLVALLLRVTRDAAHAPTQRRFRLAQTVSASAMALGHGLQDAQKTAAVVALALAVAGRQAGSGAVPVWVRLTVALSLGLGTAFGGWRIIRTMGYRIAPVDPIRGFAAEAVAAAALYAASGVFAAPVSSTHVIVASVMGGGATGGLRAIRWRVARRIALVFVLTPFATAAAAAALYGVGTRI
jgi:PiT family inorganic phosphate transporter